jgi:hypothetical protein
VQVDVGAADLGEEHVQERGAGLERRPRELADADWLVRRRDRGGENGLWSHDMNGSVVDEAAKRRKERVGTVPRKGGVTA